MSLVNEIGPQLGLDNHQKVGPKGVQDLANRRGKIKRRVKQAVDTVDPLTGHRIARHGGSGEKNAVLGEPFFERLYQDSGDQNLAH